MKRTSATRRRFVFQPPKIETHKLGPLPQIYADQFGWEEMTAAVAKVYNGLPPDVRPKTAIFGQNYGQAGAVDLFGPKYGLPKAIGGHQTYFLWGPRDYTGESMIVMAGPAGGPREKFASVEKVAHCRASLFHALRTLRYLLLPRFEVAAQGDLAEAKELGLRARRPPPHAYLPSASAFIRSALNVEGHQYRSMCSTTNSVPRSWLT